MERWGKKFVDKRDWVKYNEELVVRGEFLLDCEWVKSWDKELEEMNKGKVGRPYEYPESLICLQAVWHQWVDYRGIEGITRKLAKAGELPCCNDYTDINRRVNRLEVSFRLPQSGSCSVACDASGMKFENSGEYRARMYGKRRKYIKVTITAEPIRKELIECDVCLEGSSLTETECAQWNMKILMHHGITIDKFWGDGSYDTLDLFAFLEKHDIESAIKVRKNAALKGDNSLRDREVMEYKKKGYRKWARERQYGLRWNGTEGFFSAVKRKFGEGTRSKKIENALNEARRKFWAYDRIKKYAEMRA